MTTQLDLTLLDELAEVMGDDMAMLVASYFSDSTLKIQSLVEMDLNTQQNVIYKLAHDLKGSSRNLGAVELSNYLTKIENLARSGDLTSSDFNAERINELYQNTRKALSDKFL